MSDENSSPFDEKTFLALLERAKAGLQARQEAKKAEEAAHESLLALSKEVFAAFKMTVVLPLDYREPVMDPNDRQWGHPEMRNGAFWLASNDCVYQDERFDVMLEPTEEQLDEVAREVSARLERQKVNYR